jgi:hypothetical protein
LLHAGGTATIGTKADYTVHADSGSSGIAKIKIQDALLNPHITVNLVSRGLLDRQGYETVLGGGRAKVYNSRKKLVASGTLQRQNVYTLDTVDAKGKVQEIMDMEREVGAGPQYIQSKFAAPRNKITMTLKGSWKTLHDSVGHRGVGFMEKLQKEGFLVPDRKEHDDFFCDGCALAKIKRTPFGKSGLGQMLKAKKVGEGVHLDLMGPFRYATFGGYYYALFMVDDSSGLTVTHMIRKKNEQYGKLDEYAAWSHAQTGNRLKWFRADGEWDAGEVKRLKSKHGLEAFLTTAATPQSNGKVESVHGHLGQAACTALIVAKKGPGFLGEALQFVTYLRNVVPCMETEQGLVSRFFLFYHRHTPIHQLKPFGQEAVVRIPATVRTPGRSEPKGWEGQFVGYDLVRRAYRFWIPHLHRIVVARTAIWRPRRAVLVASDNRSRACRAQQGLGSAAGLATTSRVARDSPFWEGQTDDC